MGQPELYKIPLYYLYADPVEDVELNFLHIEPIPERSGAHDWTIHAHAHPDHVQILFVEHGGGSIHIEAQEYTIPARSVVVVPAAMVHQIHFDHGTDGTVITSASVYAASIAQGDARFLEVLAKPQVYPLSKIDENAEALVNAFKLGKREYVWSAPGRRAAIMAHFLSILVALMRLSSKETEARFLSGDRDYDLLCRYRELMEHNFRTEKSLKFFAAKLGVSTQRLNQACRARAYKTPSELLHERIIVEAKRYLIYMGMTVAQAGYELGFEDPAYFSRFFSQRVGQPPGAYRSAHIKTRDAAQS